MLYVLSTTLYKKHHGDSQERVFIFITWYKAEPAWTHALEGPHSPYILAKFKIMYILHLVTRIHFETRNLEE